LFGRRHCLAVARTNKSADPIETAARLVVEDPGGALELLLESWRDTHDGQLGQVIEEVGGRKVRPLEDLPIKVTARRDRLVTLVRAADARELSSVLAACESFARNGTAAITLPVLEACDERDEDPRIARLALRLLTDPPPRCSKVLARQLLRLVERHGDPGVRVDPATDLELDATRVERVRAKLAKRATARVPASALRAFASTGSSSAGTDEATPLIEQIAAHPDDDGPRIVLADWLTSRGDPRGELITLQLARREAKPSAAAKRREAELLANHRAGMFGPFAQCVKRSGFKFERGFLTRAVASGIWPSHPLNALLEYVDFGLYPVSLEVELRSLVEAWNPPLDSLARLIARAPRLRTLGFTFTFEPDELAKACAQVPRSMTDLTISTWGASGARDCVAAVVRSPIAATATTLQVRASYPNETTVAMLWAMVPSSCSRFIFDIVSHPQMRVELRRDGAAWTLSGSIPAHEASQLPRLQDELARALAGMPKVAHATFEVARADAVAPVRRASASIAGTTVATKGSL